MTKHEWVQGEWVNSGMGILRASMHCPNCGLRALGPYPTLGDEPRPSMTILNCPNGVDHGDCDAVMAAAILSS